MFAYFRIVTRQELPLHNQKAIMPLWRSLPVPSNLVFRSPCSDGRTLRTIRTTSIIPADLNAFLLLMERNIAAFANVTGDSSLAAQFTGYAAARQAAIDAVLWSPARGCWTDFVLDTNASAANGSSCPAVFTGAQRNGSVYAADYVPLWAGALPAGACPCSQRGTGVPSSAHTLRVLTGLCARLRVGHFCNGAIFTYPFGSVLAAAESFLRSFCPLR